MAQDLEYASRPAPNPIVAKLEALVGHDAVVAVEGYLGEGDAKSVRLYLDLTLSDYIEAGRADVLHVAEHAGETGRVTLYLPGSVTVRRVSTRIDATAAQHVRKKNADDDKEITPLGRCVAFAMGTWSACVADAVSKYPGNGPGELILREHELDLCNAQLKTDIRACFGLPKPEGGVIAH